MSVVVDFDVPARMRDGVTLRATVYRPAGGGRHPVLLARTPYGRDQPQTLAWMNPVETARQGFVVVLQDCRGRFASEGRWTPFRDERRDGHDSVEWAARLPGADGRVAMYCASYLGHTQWQAAAERPPSLRAILPAHTWSDPLDGLFARGGAVELGLGRYLELLLAGEERQATLLDDLDALAGDGYRATPVAERLLGADPAWCRVEHERVTVPSFNVAGWYDVFLQGTLDNHAAMTALGRPSRLVVGPWTHLEPFSDPTGERCFGVRAARTGVPAHPEGDLTAWQLAWLRRRLDDRVADDDAPPVRIFVMGRNTWRDEDTWPPARARAERWLLGAGGGLLRGGEPAAGAPPTPLLHDPADPVPTVGGSTVMAPAFPPGPRDQRTIEARDDVLVFTSAPLPRELEVTGRVRAVLHVDGDTPSADWVVRLCEVLPDGRSYNLCDGVTRVRAAAGRVEVDLWSTSAVFAAGHRVRVHVAASSFPRWDRTPDAGRRRLHHDAARPSWIELPVIDG